MDDKPKPQEKKYRLSAKKLNFCIYFVECGNKTEAYKKAYNTTNMTEKTIGNEASAMMRRQGIATKVAQLQHEMIEEAKIGAKWLLDQTLRLHYEVQENGSHKSQVAVLEELRKQMGVETLDMVDIDRVLVVKSENGRGKCNEKD